MQREVGHSDRRPRRRLPQLLKILGGLLLVVLLAGLALLWQYGPRFGLYLVPPSPAAYADSALKLMENGYYATGENWLAARRKAVDATRNAPDYAATLPALREALAVAGGRHSKLLNSGETLADRVGAPQLPTHATSGGVTLVKVPPIASNDAQTRQTYADTLAQGLLNAAAKTGCGWIVDLRGNTGGDMNPMLAGLSPLLSDGPLGGFIDRAGNKTLLSLQGREVQLGGKPTLSLGAENARKLSGPVAVLQDGKTASSGEVVLLAFRGREGARTFGAPSVGVSSANEVRRLYDGTEMLITVALDMDASGQVYGGVIEPQQSVAPSAAPAAARAWLKEQCR